MRLEKQKKMSIEYPLCDDEECWYKGNTDRLNEAGSSSKYWINYQKSIYSDAKSSVYDWPGEEGEYFYLCDVCDDNAHYDTYDCAICKRTMVNVWIRSDNLHYCCDCIHEDALQEVLDDSPSFKLTLASPKYKTVGGPIKTIDAWYIIRETQTSAARPGSPWYDYLKEAIRICTLEREAEEEKTKKRKRVVFEKNGKILKRWIPALTDEERERLLKRFKTELPKCENAFDFVEALVKKMPK